MLAVLSPGQGSQKPGFLAPWLELAGAEARLRWWSALAGVDLIHLGTAADADEIKDTARTQPLLVAAALLALYLLAGRPARSDTVRQGSWVAALSQVLVALVPVLVFVVGALALLAVAVLAAVALFVLLADRR